ncbi:hypothetical protein JIV24_03005 [Carboxylicivirga sp. N1Y132]|uniref:MarR family transcriptional regulator n=2 Tax=Carboxylicivirga marina TaxID=2800988 RepID=A0ABS1HF44_9BACT|nr:hypothetical protein [Carboxylicivirga marina]
MTSEDFEREWDELILKVSKHFKVSAEYEFILFVLGIQEMGWGFREYSKTEKMDLINVARCRTLVRQGYIKETGIDGEGFPIFEASPKLKSMMPSFQNQLIKKGLIEYFKTVEFA